ncbi:MAG: TIGR00159 family protein [Spirochaetales bacterium]|jgi:diadenylate cyclase|nr:TIGR00159 family protein [Spirochaetales bacterium]
MDWLSNSSVYWEYIRPILDILILSFIVYYVYKILVQTRAIQLVKGAFLIAIIYAIAVFLQLSTLLWIMNSLVTVLVIIIAIVFQPELRSIFTKIGQSEWFRFSSKHRPYQLDSVLNAVEILAGRRRGCLIVFARRVGLKNVLDTGTRLNADLSTSLILTIFGHETPLHDGAVVVQYGTVVAAGCFLPLSEQADIRRSFGTRHRAALGMVENTDAVVLVVSEESGAMSLAYDANLYYDLAPAEIRDTMRSLLDLHAGKEAETGESRLEG